MRLSRIRANMDRPGGENGARRKAAGGGVATREGSETLRGQLHAEALRFGPAVIPGALAFPGPAALRFRVVNTPRPAASSRSSRRPVFVTTHWSVVLNAGHGQATGARDALAKLCHTYWFPIYAYVRRSGHSPHDAQDLTQEFFARLLEKNWVAAADPERGRFRSFLLSALNHFLAKEWRKGQAHKRGGGVEIVEIGAAEARYGIEPAAGVTPEQQFERKWAVTLLDAVLARLGAQFERDGKEEWFEALKPCLVGDRDAQPYSALSARLGMSEAAVKTTVHRLRRRYRQLLRDEVAQTVAFPDDVEPELRHLIRVLASG